MKDQLDIDIEKIKVSRMKPEEIYIFNLLKNVNICISDENIKSKDGTIILVRNNDKYRFSHEIDRILRRDFNLLFSKRRDLLIKTLETYIKK